MCSFDWKLLLLLLFLVYLDIDVTQVINVPRPFLHIKLVRGSAWDKGVQWLIYSCKSTTQCESYKSF